MTKRTSSEDRPSKSDRRKEHRVIRHAAKAAIRGVKPRIALLSWSFVPSERRSVFAAAPEVGMDPGDYAASIVEADIREYERQRAEDDMLATFM